MEDKRPTIKYEIDIRTLSRVESFRQKYGFETRSEALNWLLDWAFKKQPQADAKQRLLGVPFDLSEFIHAVPVRKTPGSCLPVRRTPGSYYPVLRPRDRALLDPEAHREAGGSILSDPSKGEQERHSGEGQNAAC